MRFRVVRFFFRLFFSHFDTVPNRLGPGMHSPHGICPCPLLPPSRTWHSIRFYLAQLRQRSRTMEKEQSMTHWKAPASRLLMPHTLITLWLQPLHHLPCLHLLHNPDPPALLPRARVKQAWTTLTPK